MGRKRIADKEKLRNVVLVRLTDSEYKKVVSESSKTNRSLSAVIRSILWSVKYI